MKLKALLDLCICDVYVYRYSGERGTEFLYTGITVACPKELHGCNVAYMLADTDGACCGVPSKIAICLEGVK